MHEGRPQDTNRADVQVSDFEICDLMQDEEPSQGEDYSPTGKGLSCPFVRNDQPHLACWTVMPDPLFCDALGAARRGSR